VSLNVPKKLVVLNKDVVTHDLIIEDEPADILNVNTAPLRPEQHFNTAVLAYRAGTYEYYCSYHPEMRGNIIAQ
jgi:plastocyanin